MTPSPTTQNPFEAALLAGLSNALAASAQVTGAAVATNQPVEWKTFGTVLGLFAAISALTAITQKLAQHPLVQAANAPAAPVPPAA